MSDTFLVGWGVWAWLLCGGLVWGGQLDLVQRDRVQVVWDTEHSQMTYAVNLLDGVKEYSRVDLTSGEKTLLFEPGQLARALGKKLVREVDVKELKTLRKVKAVGVDGSFEFHWNDARWNCSEAYEVSKLEEIAATPSELLTRRQRSNSGGTDTSLEIQNHLDVPLSCFWISTDGAPLPYGTIEPGGSKSQHTFSGHVWSLRDGSGAEVLRFSAAEFGNVVRVDARLRDEFELLSKQSRENRRGRNQSRGQQPGNAEAPTGFLRDSEFWVEDAGQEWQLTRDSSDVLKYRGPVLHSPSGRWASAIREAVAPRRQVTLIESSPGDGVQPVVHQFDYVKPGDPIDRPEIALFDVVSRQEIAVPNQLFATPWALSQFEWLDDPERLMFVYNQRGHQVMRVLTVAADTGEVSVVIEETSPTFIDYSNKTFLQSIEQGRQLLWMSERSGWNHLYRFDSQNGELINAVTQGDWVVRGVERVDQLRQQVWFSASGMNPAQDPYYLHLCRVDFDGQNLTVLTEGDGNHSWEFSPDQRWLIDRFSRVDLPTVTTVRSAEDGALICELERGDATALLESGWSMPEHWVAKGRDGKTDIYGVIVWPENTAEDRKYPIVEKIYAGPHDSHVPKSFGLMTQEHEIANMGCVVVRIDGMGTSNRGKRFHDVCWKNLADAGFPDRIAWIEQAAQQHSQLDAERVGIFGGSAGGQNAMRALLNHHDFYSVAVADCGCHDNRMDKIWWNEAWMGWPVDDAYSRSSNVEDAHRLQGKLLLIVGEMDRNVDPSSTLQVAHALIQADKDFELLVLPGVGHGAAETPYGRRRRAEFLRQYLLESD